MPFNGDPKEGMDGFSEQGAHVQSMGIPRLHPDAPKSLGTGLVTLPEGRADNTITLLQAGWTLQPI